jgi:integrase
LTILYDKKIKLVSAKTSLDQIPLKSLLLGGLSLMYNDSEILRFAIKNGKLDLSSVQLDMDKEEREYYLSLHRYERWQGKNGKWYTYIPEKEGRVLKKRNSEEDILNLIVSFYKSQKEEPTISDMFKDWVNIKLESGEIGRGTFDRYTNDYIRFFKGTSFERMKVKDITVDDLEDFIKKTIMEHKLTRKAFANCRILIYGIFKRAKKKKNTQISITWFMKDLELSKNIFVKVIHKKEDQVYQENEIPLAVEYLKNNPAMLNLGLLLAFQSGLRCGELAALKPTDIVGKAIHVQRQEIKYKDPDTQKCTHEIKEYPKTDMGNRYVIITDSALETIEMIKQLNPDGEFLFEVKGKRIMAHNYNGGIERMCKALNIPQKSMHKIRRTYGTTLIDEKVDESLIMEQMGHSDISTTQKFYYFSNKTQKTKEAQIEKAISI